MTAESVHGHDNRRSLSHASAKSFQDQSDLEPPWTGQKLWRPSHCRQFPYLKFWKLKKSTEKFCTFEVIDCNITINISTEISLGRVWF